MTRQPKVGLLPLYLELYDQAVPEALGRFGPFIEAVAGGLEQQRVDVVRADVCRVNAQFRKAVERFERKDVDLIVTLHLAYSPSLESVDLLAATKLPILMLDTTMDHDFGLDAAPDRIMYNHGIHGVQDLASMLRRRKKPFEIVAGHVTESDVLARAADAARAAYAAACFGTTRALRIGARFRGMGDFVVYESVLRDVLGTWVDEIAPDDLAADVSTVTDEDVDAEMQRDADQFVLDLPEEVHRRSVRVGLGLRRRLEQGEYDVFSMNFAAFDSPDPPVDTVPFLEASKAMARGMGYAGEGDILTASLVGALNRAFGKTTFTEVFCPDWKGGTLFLSHMGEVNPETAAGQPRLIEKPFPYTPAHNPAVLTCAIANGPAVLVNLAPGPDDRFGLIVAPVEVVGDTTVPEMRDAVRGWIRPACSVEAFLEQYSRLGGTHHSALVLGVRAEAIAAFASFAGLECSRI